MDKLNIDFQSLLPYVIDAFSYVYGEEYRSVISKKINNAVVISYHNTEGLEDYVFYLKRCKACEFSIQFLDEIGIDVSKYKKSNYTEYLDNDVEEILENYIDSPTLGFSKRADRWAPLRAFSSDNSINPEKLLENKLKIINYLLGSEHEQITEENFNTFTKTEEYLELLKKINQYNIVYERLLSEYNKWTLDLLPYEKYIDYEQKRKENILQKNKNEIFQDIFSKLPSFIKNMLFDKTIEEQQEIILGSEDISSTSLIEYFHQEQMEKLMSSEVEFFDKYRILLCQTNYLKKFGIIVPIENNVKFASEEYITKYLHFLNQDYIRKYIPSEDLLHYISLAREKKYEETLREFYTTRKDFTDVIKMFGNNQKNFEIIYSNIKNKRINIIGEGATNSNNEFISIMFYTIRQNDGGLLFHIFMHENGHIIDQSQNGCGFESMANLSDKNLSMNPYDKAFRKYEKFNETLNDIFTMEAVEFLQNQGIYLIEPKEFTSLETTNRVSNQNTALITKDLLKPLIQKFRQQIIKAKINANPEELVKYIGKDNFENLVDAVNKVDYLSRNGVVSKNDKDPMVLEYCKQVGRVNQIYISIDEYYANNFETLSTDNYENSIPKK